MFFGILTDDEPYAVVSLEIAQMRTQVLMWVGWLEFGFTGSYTSVVLASAFRSKQSLGLSAERSELSEKAVFET